MENSLENSLGANREVEEQQKLSEYNNQSLHFAVQSKERFIN